MTDNLRLEDLLNIYDVEFLAYVINEESENVLRRIAGDLPAFDTEKEAVLSQLVAMENQLRELPVERRTLERSALLAQHREELASTVTSFFREACGGKKDLPRLSDPVEQLLLHFAEVTYPLHLQKDNEPDAFTSIHFPWRDPKREELYAAVMADSVLSKLYPIDSDHSGPSGSALRSTGLGGGVQLWMFAENITTAAWHDVHFGSEKPGFRDYVQSVLHIVRTLRRSLQGRSAVVPMRIGIAGVLLPEGVDSIDLGWAKLRRADRRDAHFTRRTPVGGQLQHTNSAGESIMIDYAGNLVLELDIPYKVILKNLDVATPWPAELDQASLITEPIECLRLALLLAGVGENSTAVPTWQSVVDPLHGAESVGWSDPRQRINLVPVQLTAETLESWQEWANRIRTHRTPQTSVSIRRILRAVSERKEPEDTLIDAVIVWENLFGAAQETTLRVTMSVAWMLGGDAKGRTRLVKELKDIYQQRSDIIHGNAKLKMEKTYPCAMRAIEISIELLRIMFRDHPKFLELKSGSERSALVLLDAMGAIPS